MYVCVFVCACAQLYRANLPLSRDVRALYRLTQGTMAIRVCLWDRYVAYSDPFEVKAKQQASELLGTLHMRSFVDLQSLDSAPDHPAEYNSAKRRRTEEGEEEDAAADTPTPSEE